MKKVLILTASAGGGHNAVSDALRQSFEERGVEVKIVDFYQQCAGPLKNWIMSTGYKLSCKYVRPIYNFCYNSKKGKANAKTSKKILLKLKETIDAYQPDIVVAVHVFVAAALANLKRRYGVNAVTSFVVTDYCIYPYVKDVKPLDYIVLPHESFVSEFLEMGFEEGRLLVYGIPVKNNFSVYKDKSVSRQQLNLDDKFTLLVMTGGGGFGNIVSMLKHSARAQGDYQIICINGKDKNSYKRIEKFVKKNNLGHVHNFGFVDEVHPYMQASDAMLGKCGAIALTEALNAWVPLICKDKQISNELDNLDFLRENEAVLCYSRFGQLPTLLSELIKNQSKLDDIKKNILKIRKLDATNKFVDKMLSL